MRINHNIAALNTYRQLGSANNMQSKSMEKLSSGLRINRAGDDAAGLAISEKMRGQIRGLDMASKNAQDGVSMLQTAEGALNETHSILQRMRELAVQSSNDTNTDDDRLEIQKEISQLVDEIDRIGNNTEFNTKNLLDGSLSDESKVRSLDTAALTTAGGVSNVKVGSASSLAADTYSLDIVTNSKALNGSTDYHTTGISNINVNADSDLAEGSYIVDVTGSIASTGTVTSSSITAATVTNSELADGTYALRISDDTGGSETAQLFSVAADGTETQVGSDIDISGSLGGSVTVDGVDFSIAGAVTAGEELVFNQQTTYSAQLLESDGSTTIGSAVTIQPNDTKVQLGNATSGITADFGAAIAEGEATFAVKATGETTAILKDSSNNVIEEQVVQNNQKRVDLGSTGVSFQTGTLTDGSTSGIKVDVTTQDNSLKFQIGANENQEMNLGISDMRSSALSVDGIDVTSQANAKGAVSTINDAIQSVSAERSKLGAVQNRLEHTINNLGTSSENLTAAESRIRDVDYALAA